MKKYLFPLSAGIVAGTIDVIPMVLQKLDWYACSSAFAQWLFLGFVITYTRSDMKGWLKGSLISLFAAVPVMILVAKDDLTSIVPIMIMSIILGGAVGYAGDRYKVNR